MWATLFSVFTTVFLAEMGDKTQVATLLFASDRHVNRWVVFVGAFAGPDHGGRDRRARRG